MANFSDTLRAIHRLRVLARDLQDEINRAPIQLKARQAVVAKAKYQFPVEKLKAEADVLRFAAGLERGAISAYLGAVPLFADHNLAQVAASILGDEAMHWAVLRQVLGENPVPSAFMS